ncbi:MAG: hypothetical protein N2258_03875 [Brevinematales bacterium]|nr:hypothetical protein [Brevinematales bacterium]
MIYLETLKKYTFGFLKVLLWVILFSLIYFFYLLAYFKVTGTKGFLLLSVGNYFAFIINSLPFVIIFSTMLFFSFAGQDKFYIIKFLPIINIFNTIILTLFFLLNLKFLILYENKEVKYIPIVRENYLNVFGPYRFYYEKNDRGGLTKGILFYKDPYLLSSVSVKDDYTYLSTSHLVGKTSLYANNSFFKVKIKEDLISLKSSPISPFLLKIYENYNIKLKNFFEYTFKTGGIIISIIAIYILFLGFSGFIVSIGSYFGKKEIYSLSFSTILVLSVVFFVGLPVFLNLTHLIKLGIKNKLFEVIIPSLIVGVFAGMIGYGLIELKILMNKMYGNK